MHSFPPGAVEGLLSLQLLLWNELLLQGKAELRLDRPGAASPHHPHLADSTPGSSSSSPGTLHSALTTHTLPWRSFLSYEHSRTGSSSCRRWKPFSPLPSLPIQTRSRPRFLYTASGMVLHFLGSVVLWGHKSLLAEMTFKHKKTLPCAKPVCLRLETAHSRVSHLCSSSWLSLPPSFSSQRGIWGFHFYCRPQLIWLFYERFPHLHRHKIRIQFSRTDINCQPSLLICIFCPREIFLIFTVFHPSLIIPAFS